LFATAVLATHPTHTSLLLHYMYHQIKQKELHTVLSHIYSVSLQYELITLVEMGTCSRDRAESTFKREN
jgi:hypothetical protein